MTNNKIKTLAMWQGLSLAQQIGIQNIRVLENSLLITKHMVDNHFHMILQSKKLS